MVQVSIKNLLKEKMHVIFTIQLTMDIFDHSPTDMIKPAIKKVKFTIKKKETKSKTKSRSKKPVDPAKVNAAQALQRIAFTRVEDRFLMDEDVIQKDDLLKPFVGFDTPTTCQINLNYLFTKAITCMDKRMAAVEKHVKLLSDAPGSQSSDTVTRFRVKREVAGGFASCEVAGGFASCEEDKATQVCEPIEEKEPGEIDMVNESQTPEV
jgi:hypothetical protein